MSHHDRLREPWPGRHAAGAAGLSKTWLLVGLACVLLGFGALAMLTRARDAAHPRLQAPIVYCRLVDARFEVVSLEAGAQQSRTLYAATLALHPLALSPLLPLRDIVPDMAGTLPSPDGAWILVWAPTANPSRSLDPTAGTEWVAVRAEDGRQVRLAVSEDAVLSRPLPWWLDDTHVVLDGGTTPVVYDVADSTRPGEGRSIDSAAGGSAQSSLTAERLREYFGRHCAREKNAYVSAATTLEAALGLDQWRQRYPRWATPRDADTRAILERMAGRLEAAGQASQWRLEDPAILTLGLPGLSRLRHPAWPPLEMSSSPDGTLLARADREVSHRLKVRSRLSEGVKTVRGARVDVFTVSSQERVWGTEALPRVTEAGASRGPIALADPPPPLWTEPEFREVRWSSDGRYLSLTLHDDPTPSVIVADTATWREVLRIPNAMNAFVLPAAGGTR